MKRTTFTEETEERDVPEFRSREYQHRIVVWELDESGPMTPWSDRPPARWRRVHVISGAFMDLHGEPEPTVARGEARREAWKAFQAWTAKERDEKEGYR